MLEYAESFDHLDIGRQPKLLMLPASRGSRLQTVNFKRCMNSAKGFEHTDRLDWSQATLDNVDHCWASGMLCPCLTSDKVQLGEA